MKIIEKLGNCKYLQPYGEVLANSHLTALTRKLAYPDPFGGRVGGVRREMKK